jgi:hypothetical protein
MMMMMMMNKRTQLHDSFWLPVIDNRTQKSSSENKNTTYKKTKWKSIRSQSIKNICMHFDLDQRSKKPNKNCTQD